jgi:hypothetical protein
MARDGMSDITFTGNIHGCGNARAEVCDFPGPHRSAGSSFATIDLGNRVSLMFDSLEQIATWCDDVAGKARALMPAEATTSGEGPSIAAAMIPSRACAPNLFGEVTS